MEPKYTLPFKYIAREQYGWMRQGRTYRHGDTHRNPAGSCPYKTSRSILVHHTGHNRVVPGGGRPGTQAT